MSKNPFYNALAALAYIVIVVLAMNSISGIETNAGEFIMPIMVISLFTLSAAVMVYIFCYLPLRLYLDGKKEEAVSLFLRTLGIFAGITFGIIIIYLLIVRS